jgi:hypothetical protein
VAAAIFVISLYSERYGWPPFDWYMLPLLPLLGYALIAINRLEYHVGAVEQSIGLEDLKNSPKSLGVDDPITPDHAPPDPPAKHDPSISPETHACFEHFVRFADVMNERVFVHTLWRLQESAERGYSRQYEIFHGSKRCGRLFISGGDTWRYAADNPRVSSMVEIWNARAFNSEILTRFLEELALRIAGGTPEEFQRSRQVVLNSMVLAMWQVGPDRVIEPATLKVWLQGSAKRYLEEAEIIPRKSLRDVLREAGEGYPQS